MFVSPNAQDGQQTHPCHAHADVTNACVKTQTHARKRKRRILCAPLILYPIPLVAYRCCSEDGTNFRESILALSVLVDTGSDRFNIEVVLHQGLGFVMQWVMC